MYYIKFLFRLILLILVSPFILMTCLLCHDDEIGFKEAFIGIVDIIFY